MRNLVFYMYVGGVSISGNWLGQGVMTDALEKEVNCSVVRFNVQQSDHILHINNGQFVCDAMKMNWEFPPFTLESNKIVFAGNKIGEITDARIKFMFKDPAGGLLKKIDISKEGSQVVYREFWVNENSNSVFMSFSARLSASNIF